jgi:hypothetical protein
VIYLFEEDIMTHLAGLSLVAKRIDAKVARAIKRAARPKRPTAAELLYKARLAGLYKPKQS